MVILAFVQGIKVSGTNFLDITILQVNRKHKLPCMCTVKIALFNGNLSLQHCTFVGQRKPDKSEV